MGGCGQIDMEYWHRDETQNDERYNHLTKPEELRFTKGWSADLWLELLDVWSKYHLKKLDEVPAYVWEWLDSLPVSTRTPAWV